MMLLDDDILEVVTSLLLFVGEASLSNQSKRQSGRIWVNREGWNFWNGIFIHVVIHPQLFEMINLIQILTTALIVVNHDIGYLECVLLFHQWTVSFLNFTNFSFLIFVNVFNSINFFVFFNNYFWSLVNFLQEVCKVRLASLTAGHFELIILILLLTLQVIGNILAAKCYTFSIPVQVFGLVERHHVEVGVEADTVLNFGLV